MRIFDLENVVKWWWEKKHDDCMDIYIQWVPQVLVWHPYLMFWSNTSFYYNWTENADLSPYQPRNCRMQCFCLTFPFSFGLDYGQTIHPHSLQFPLLITAVIFGPTWCSSWTTDNQHFDLSLYLEFEHIRLLTLTV